MRPTTDIHSCDMWLALFHQDADRTIAYGDALAARIDTLGIIVDPVLLTSLAAYHQAQQRWTETTPLLAQARTNTLQVQSPSLSSYPDCRQWLELIEHASPEALPFLVPETPTINEWLVLIQRDAVQAQQHVTHLQAQVSAFDAFLKKPDIHTVEEFRQARHLHIGPQHTFSIEHYETAQGVIANLTNHARPDTAVAKRLRLGRATLTAYPDYTDWPVLLVVDSAFAHALWAELELKAATLGLAAPCILQFSIADARKVLPPIRPSRALTPETRAEMEDLLKAVQAHIEATERALRE